MSSPSELSFLPDDYLEQKAQRRTNVICAVLFLVVMAGIGVAFSIGDKTTRSLEQQHQAISAKYTDAARRIEQSRQMEQNQRTMAHQAELTASLLEKVPRSYLLADITRSLPAGVSLMEFSLESKLKNKAPAAAPKTPAETRRAAEAKKAAGPEPRKYDVLMKLTGMAANDGQVSEFLSRLQRSKLLVDVNLIISDEYKVEQQTLRKFVVEMTLNPSAEVDPTDSEPKMAAVELQNN